MRRGAANKGNFLKRGWSMTARPSSKPPSAAPRSKGWRPGDEPYRNMTGHGTGGSGRGRSGGGHGGW